MHNTPWGPAPAAGRFTYWPADDRWHWSREVYAIFGLETEREISTDLVLEHTHPEDVEQTRAVLSRVGSNGPFSFTHRIVDADHLVHTVVSVGSDELGESGTIERLDGFIVDLTDVPRPAWSLPMVPVEFDPADLVITGCVTCAQWWAEVAHSSSGQLVVREWHEASCPEALRWSTLDEVDPSTEPAREQLAD
ncbi:PAS domain-containing protein [Mumia flava]|uniref:PAS domain-containing protein n=1 Tax=Mumia flava TaxID=1348852 RepID=A0A2M9B7L2_9ACTN|nr:PAS domain-containing protein [Mumia flava]PJJ53934.1 PAS domain-containing protein [Mumia flava]